MKKDYRHTETDYVVHTTCGLLNFLGGAFKTEDLDNKSFSQIVDSLLCNGANIEIGVNKSSVFGKEE